MGSGRLRLKQKRQKVSGVFRSGQEVEVTGEYISSVSGKKHYLRKGETFPDLGTSGARFVLSPKEPSVIHGLLSRLFGDEISLKRWELLVSTIALVVTAACALLGLPFISQQLRRNPHASLVIHSVSNLTGAYAIPEHPGICSYGRVLHDTRLAESVHARGFDILFSLQHRHDSDKSILIQSIEINLSRFVAIPQASGFQYERPSCYYPWYSGGPTEFITFLTSNSTLTGWVLGNYEVITQTYRLHTHEQWFRTSKQAVSDNSNILCPQMTVRLGTTSNDDMTSFLGHVIAMEPGLYEVVVTVKYQSGDSMEQCSSKPIQFVFSPEQEYEPESASQFGMVPPVALAHWARGSLYIASAPIQTIRDCTRAIDVYSQCPWFYRDRGTAYRRAQMVYEATQDYKIWTELEPTSAYAHVELAKVLAHQGALNEAMEEIREAVRLKPVVCSWFQGLMLEDELAIANHPSFPDICPKE